MKGHIDLGSSVVHLQLDSKFPENQHTAQDEWRAVYWVNENVTALNACNACAYLYRDCHAKYRVHMLDEVQTVSDFVADLGLLTENVCIVLSE